jgi:hypothetical protein
MQLKGSEMDDRKRSVLEELEYDLTIRYFASAFEACDQLPTADQQLVLKDVARRVAERLSAVQPEEHDDATNDAG